MIYQTRPGRVCSGEAIGILLLDTSVPFVPGDVANATTYSFPVRFRKVEGFTVERALGRDPGVYECVLEAARDLERQGVRAITGDCGFMGIHQKRLAREVSIPVFLSSLLQIPFISNMISDKARIAVITADSRSLDAGLLEAVGVADASKLVLAGLENRPHFYRFAIEESGSLDTGAVEKELVETARNTVAENPDVRAILLECSLLPPYGAAVQEAVNLPVFDYITMIDHVFSAVVKKRYTGFI